MNKDIQKSRMRKLFIDAAKEILLKEGVSNVTVRKVGEATGYSYATIYNYFSNLDHLLWYVGMEFIEEISGIFKNEQERDGYEPEDFYPLLKKYCDYYLDHPNIFKFFFFHSIEEPLEIKSGEYTRPSLEKVQMRILENLACRERIKPENVKVISSLLMNSIHGMLLMYFSKKRKTTREELYIMAQEMLQFLFVQQTHH